jgi:hypothetical protein
MAHENGGCTDSSQGGFHRGHVGGEFVEAVLTGNHFMPLRLESWNHFTEARAVGPKSMNEHDAGFSLPGGHVYRSCCVKTQRYNEPRLGASLEGSAPLCAFQPSSRAQSIVREACDGGTLRC